MSALSEETNSCKRMSRYKRRVFDKPLCFTPRDFTILHTLYKYHSLTTHQIVAIHQGGVSKRHAGVDGNCSTPASVAIHTKTRHDLRARSRWSTRSPTAAPIGSPRIDPTSSDSILAINERNTLDDPSTIPHTLMVAEIMLRFELSAYFHPADAAFIPQQVMLAHAPEVTRNRRSPTHWNNSVFIKGEKFIIGNNPDQIFGVVDKQRPKGRNTLYFFLEADRATETVRPTTTHLDKSTIYKKMVGYYQTHLQKVHHGVFGDWMRNFRARRVIDYRGRPATGRPVSTTFSKWRLRSRAGQSPTCSCSPPPKH